MHSAHLVVFCRTVLGLAFAVAALGKLRELRDLNAAVASINLLPARLTRVAVAGAIAAEVASVVLLASWHWPAMAGFALAILLLLAYTAALTAMLLRHIPVGCHCFGSDTRPVSWYDVVRNLLLLGSGLVGLVAGLRIGAGVSAGDTVLTCLMAVAVVAVVANFADVAETLRKPIELT